mmetsp:Transcript_100591/g.322913  ORF Transcript_100591/g.322913 Transcript_100591/m.322913 type:complete len:509 (+) Transcript_100591:68-1594(+)|eukprot:CAMPEP_0203908502 /NCGR_PEP_ID=MMETSP0359-20131031/49880_1 /ASSEMBLY_ACC=CAM_ASM_000338 /TAXON_ID=268821 /ORGANISM="Scrippsiella Hangoei, Strain SHTV-5" /LENGTH=508 /DNA_ID=CAMNT_0050833521 /DNA_START=41 /DNA_END=1567 /DNA_ORIENTATION=-
MASTAEADDRPESQVVEYHSLRELAFPLYLPTLLAHATRSVTLTVLPLHIFATGFSYDDVGLLSTIYGLGAAFGNIPAGAWATLHGPRSTLFVSCWLFGLSAASASLVGVSGKLRFPCFCFAFLLLGIAETVGIFARQLFMGSTTRGALTDHASSTQGGVARIATTFAPLIGGVVAETWSPTAVYKLQGVFAVLCAASTYAYVPHISSTQDLGKPNAKVKECRPNQQGSAMPLSFVGVMREHWPLLAKAVFFVSGIFFFRRARELLFSLEGHARDMSQAEVGRIVALSFLIDLALFPVAGIMMSTLGKTCTGGVFFLLMAVSLVVLSSGSSAGFWAFALLAGISNGISSGLTLSFGAQLAPASCRSNFLAVFRTLARAGDPLASELLGVVTNAGSLRLAELLVAIIAVLNACWALACVPEPQQQHALPKASLRHSWCARRFGALVGPDKSYAAVPEISSCTVGKSVVEPDLQGDVELAAEEPGTSTDLSLERRTQLPHVPSEGHVRTS